MFRSTEIETACSPAQNQDGKEFDIFGGCDCAKFNISTLSTFQEMHEFLPGYTVSIRSIEEATIKTSNQLDKSAEHSLFRCYLLIKDGTSQSFQTVGDTVPLFFQFG